MRFKSLAVFAIRIIENTVKVAMLLVDMAGHEILILAFKELLTYLLTELQGSLRCDFPLLKSNTEFWVDKINKNIERDALNTEKLISLGWNVITIWECELKKDKREDTLSALQHRLECSINP